MIIMKKLLFLILLLIYLQPLNAQNKKAKHVVLIGIDGLGAYSFKKADMPNIKKLMERGITIVKCTKLGIHGHGSRTGASWI
jgi:predicted AlkP superfamily pyrophosphatase or phosphodiesterase